MCRSFEVEPLIFNIRVAFMHVLCVSARSAKCDRHSVVFILVFLATSGVKSKVKGEGISS